MSEEYVLRKNSDIISVHFTLEAAERHYKLRLNNSEKSDVFTLEHVTTTTVWEA